MLAFIGNLGWTELLLILGVALLFFGARRLPELGRSLGEGIKNFRGSMNEGMKDDAAKEDEAKKPVTPS